MTESKKINFLIADTDIQIDNFNSYTFSLTLILKGELKTFERQVYTLMSMIGDVGGLADGLFLLTGFFFSFYNSSLFGNELAGNLFRVQSKQVEFNDH